MALRNIREDGDAVLRKKSRKVDKIDSKIITLLDDMVETMNHADGVGLAAPQIGILKRVVVIDVGDGVIELINPEILEVSGKQTDDEGCLSVPGKYGKVTRPDNVKVRAFNRNGEQFEIEGKGLLARAFCHELDHLEGILFTDKVEGKLQG